jgi:hypothetical protein
MALPSVRDLEAAVLVVYNGLATYKAKMPGAREAVRSLQSVGLSLSNIYKSMLSTSITIGDTDDADLQAALVYPQLTMTVTDATDADLATFFAAAGELYVALTRAPAVGDAFKVTGVGDTTDNALQTAKGGAVAANDVFIVSNIGTPAVVYAGNDNEIGDAFGRRVQVGDTFAVAGTGDTTDNALQGAKDASLLPTIDIVITDLADADVATMIGAAGQVGVALGRAMRAGDVLQVGGTGDSTDNGLQTAKGSAPADGDKFIVDAAATGVTYFVPTPVASDIFEVTNVTIGSEAVAYLGQAPSFVDEEVSDFTGFTS